MFAFRKVAEYQYNTTNMKDEGYKNVCRNLKMLSNFCFPEACKRDTNIVMEGQYLDGKKKGRALFKLHSSYIKTDPTA